MLATSLFINAVLVVASVAMYVAIRAIRRGEIVEIKRFELAEPTDERKFLAELGLTADSQQARDAMAIRSAIAELGEVPSTSIRAEHRFFPDLKHLPFYDSIDFLGLILETEKKTNFKIKQIHNDKLYDLIANGTVADYILAVIHTQQPTAS
jgi:hypothetical protein